MHYKQKRCLQKKEVNFLAALPKGTVKARAEPFCNAAVARGVS